MCFFSAVCIYQFYSTVMCGCTVHTCFFFLQVQIPKYPDEAGAVHFLHNPLIIKYIKGKLVYYCYYLFVIIIIIYSFFFVTYWQLNWNGAAMATTEESRDAGAEDAEIEDHVCLIYRE